MSVTIAQNSIETVSNLIRNEFHNIDFDMDYIYNKADNLIRTAEDFGLLELADELKNSLQ